MLLIVVRKQPRKIIGKFTNSVKIYLSSSAKQASLKTSYFSFLFYNINQTKLIEGKFKEKFNIIFKPLIILFVILLYNLLFIFILNRTQHVIWFHGWIFICKKIRNLWRKKEIFSNTLNYRVKSELSLYIYL